MAEYIEREALVHHFMTKQRYLTKDLVMDAACEISKIPAADVAPVRHGRWVHFGGDEWCCSYCGEVISTEGSWEKPTKKFCNECGAKMDLEDK